MYKKYFYIFLAIFASFMVVKFATPNIFIADSPELRSDILARFFNKKTDKVAEVERGKLYEALKKLPLIPIGNGVYARSNDKAVAIEFNVAELKNIQMESIELTNRMGRAVTIRYPKGQKPSQELIDLIIN